MVFQSVDRSLINTFLKEEDMVLDTVVWSQTCIFY